MHMAAPLLRDVWETCPKKAGIGIDSCFIHSAPRLDKTLYRCLQMKGQHFFLMEKTQFGKKVK